MKFRIVIQNILAPYLVFNYQITLNINRSAIEDNRGDVYNCLFDVILFEKALNKSLYYLYMV